MKSKLRFEFGHFRLLADGPLATWIALAIIVAILTVPRL